MFSTFTSTVAALFGSNPSCDSISTVEKPDLPSDLLQAKVHAKVKIVALISKPKPIHSAYDKYGVPNRKITSKHKSLKSTKITINEGHGLTGEFPYLHSCNDVTLKIKCKTEQVADCIPWEPFLSQLPHLTTLVYAYNDGNDIHQRIWELLGSNQNLKTLENIEAPSILYPYGNSLNSLFQNNAANLKKVNFNFSLVKVDMLLSGVTEFPQLESINLKSSCIEDFGMLSLGTLVKNAPRLHTFKCSNWNWDGNYVYGPKTFQTLLTSLEACATLTNLSLGLDNKECTQLLFQGAITKILQLPLLTRFALRSKLDLVAAERLKEIGQLISSRTFEKCKFFGLADLSQFAAFIEGLSGTTTLRGLNINFPSELPEAGVGLLADFISNNSSLELFSLGLTMTSAGVATLATALKINQTVRHLKINYGCMIPANDAETLCEALNAREVALKTLQIGSSATSTACAAAFEPLIARGTDIRYHER
jgi:hypothetical protein